MQIVEKKIIEAHILDDNNDKLEYNDRINVKYQYRKYRDKNEYRIEQVFNVSYDEVRDADKSYYGATVLVVYVCGCEIEIPIEDIISLEKV